MCAKKIDEIDGSMFFSGIRLYMSMMLKTIKSGKEFQENKLLEFFHYLFTFNYEL